ncbi:hypothetical protein GCM10009731_54230 [Streptomyces globosus]
MCRPAPPSSQSGEDFTGVDREAPVEGLAGVGEPADGDGRGVAAELLGEGDGEGLADGFVTASHAGGVLTTTGADRATGGVCLVEPTTNWTVPSTAVTLAAVHDSHMSR